MTDMAADQKAKRNVGVLVLAQAILGAQMPMIFTVGGLAGQSLASNVCLATLPISLIVLGSMLTATPLSAFMQRFGRRAGFLLRVFCPLRVGFAFLWPPLLALPGESLEVSSAELRAALPLLAGAAEKPGGRVASTPRLGRRSQVSRRRSK